MSKADLLNSLAATRTLTLRDLFNTTDIAADNPRKHKNLPVTATDMLCTLVSKTLDATFGAAAEHVEVFFQEESETNPFCIILRPFKNFDEDLTATQRYLYRDRALETIDRFLDAIDLSTPSGNTEIHFEDRVILADSKMDMLDLFVALTSSSQPGESFIDVQEFKIVTPDDMKHREGEYLKELKKEHLANVWKQTRNDPFYVDKLLMSSFTMPFTSIEDYFYRADCVHNNVDQDHLRISNFIELIKQKIIQEDNLVEKDPARYGFHFPRVSVSLN